jgi:hypothetical protein
MRALTIVFVLLVFGCGSDGRGSDDDDGSSGRSCGPSSCNGCCASDGTCLDGTEDTACGGSGSSCMACSSGERCSSSGVCRLCNATNCTGCCDDNGECQAGTSAPACGHSGNACDVCGGPTHPNATQCCDVVEPYCGVYQPTPTGC